MRWTGWVCLGALCAWCGVAGADLPSIRFDRMQPLGCSAGGKVEVEVVGGDLEGLTGLLLGHPGLQATPVEGKERRFRIQAAGDVPEGTYDVRLVGRFGVSNPRLLAVSKEFREVADNEKNRSLAEAQPIELNTAVNGQIDGNRDDYYKFTATRGQRITIDCQAQRLDSELDGTMSLLTPAGAILATNSDYFGQDPFLDFVAPADGEYVVALHDLSYRGGYSYRLVVSTRPQVESIFPAALQIGKETMLTALGRNLGAGSHPSTWTVNDLPLEELSFPYTPAAEGFDTRSYRFRSHPTHHSVAPTAATCTLAGMQVLPDSLSGTWNGQTVLLTEHPVVLEQEPNDAQASPQKVTLPLVLAGRFGTPRDADWYSIEATEDGPHYFDVYCERIAGRADPYVAIFDDKGNRMTELDDFGHRINGFDGHLRDPSSQPVGLSKGKTYTVLVQDRYQRGGARYQYVLEVRRPHPDFFVAAMHSSNQNPAGTNLGRGGSVYVDIVIHHEEGFQGPITVTAEGLPPGVSAAPTVVNNNSRGSFVFWAGNDAADWTGTVKLWATGERDGATIRREVRSYSRVWGNGGTSQPARELAIGVRDTSPFSLRFEPEQVTVEAGQTLKTKIKVERNWPEFKEKLTVQNLGWPGEFQMGNFDILSDKSEAEVSIEVRQGTRPGDYTLVAIGQAQVPYNKDPMAKDRPNTLVTLPARPLQVKVVEAPKK